MISKETLRERVRSPKKNKVDWLKWIGSPTAWLALILSASVAYLNFRKADMLSVVVGSVPRAKYSSGEFVEITGWTPTLVFVNSGARPVIVSSVNAEMWIQQKTTPLKLSCGPTRDGDEFAVIHFKYDMSPLVVKPGEMVNVDVDATASEVYGASRDSVWNGAIITRVGTKGKFAESWDSDRISWVQPAAPTEGHEFGACLKFDLVRVNDGLKAVEVRLGVIPFERVHKDLLGAFLAPLPGPAKLIED